MRIDPFHIRARNLIRSLIRQRAYLIDTHQSRRDPDSFQADLTFLRLHLDANGYNTDGQMARFWMHHHDKVRHLIPGKGSPVHESMMKAYRDLTREAGTIYTQNLITPDILPKNPSTINP